MKTILGPKLPNGQESFQSMDTHVEWIPQGKMCSFQVIDVGINKSFKGYTRELFEEFMLSSSENKI